MFVDLLINVLPIVCGVLCLSLFCYALLCVLSSFAIILKRKRELIALLLMSYGCLVTVNDMWFFLMMPWVGLQCVIVVFPEHTHLFTDILITTNPLPTKKILLSDCFYIFH